MRAADVTECVAMGHSPRQALRAGLLSSSMCLTAMVDGRPEAMFGLVVTNALCGEGSPWMLGSDAIYRHPRTMLRWGPRILSAMFDSTPVLENLVAGDNHRAIRFLRRIGFTIGKEVIMIAGISFVPFSQERAHV
jgi:ribosomal protein S18 acetylase RimI-like enzyme